MDKQTESREQFQAWWEKSWFGDSPASNWSQLWGCDGYIDEEINSQWEAWQASRESLVIELPTEHELRQVVCSECASNSLELVENRIRAIGIRIKGEGV